MDETGCWSSFLKRWRRGQASQRAKRTRRVIRCAQISEGISSYLRSFNSDPERHAACQAWPHLPHGNIKGLAVSRNELSGTAGGNNARWTWRGAIDFLDLVGNEALIIPWERNAPKAALLFDVRQRGSLSQIRHLSFALYFLSSLRGRKNPIHREALDRKSIPKTPSLSLMRACSHVLTNDALRVDAESS